MTINEINQITYVANQFKLHPEEKDAIPVFVDLKKYMESTTTWNAYFPGHYAQLLYDLCEALDLKLLFTLTTPTQIIDGNIFIPFKTKKVKNKKQVIKTSSYLLHIIRTYEETDFIFHRESIRAIFKFDDLRVIRITQSVIQEYLIKDSSHGQSENLKEFIKNCEATIKSMLSRETLGHKKNKHEKVLKTESVKSSFDEEVLSIKEAASFLKISRQTLSRYTNEKKVKAHGIGNRVFYKKKDLLESLKSLN